MEPKAYDDEVRAVVTSLLSSSATTDEIVSAAMEQLLTDDRLIEIELNGGRRNSQTMYEAEKRIRAYVSAVTSQLQHAAGDVLTVTEMRNELPKLLDRFRSSGAATKPVVFGANRKPEGVILPFDLYSTLLPVVEDVKKARTERNNALDNAVSSLRKAFARLRPSF